MSENKPFLTISLLSSGRSGTIERCLSSLAPFKEQLDTEIIVVDTDLEHRADVHTILEKYADKIIPFEWCDDFSAARNVGVDAASGEWFMYVDDDEWFIDALPLVDFLKSSDSKKYNRISYRIRNYGDEDFITYGDSFASRLFRLDGKAKFESKVHEYIKPVGGNGITIEALAGHARLAEENKKEQLAKNREEMKHIIESLEKKVDDLVGAGMLDEADIVLQKIQKYTSLIE